MENKICYYCHESKTTDEFYKSKNPKRIGVAYEFSGACKECTKKILKKYYLENKSHVREIRKKWLLTHHSNIIESRRKSRRKLKIDTLRAYGGEHPKCKCCGEDNIWFLTIDHINGGGYKHLKEIGLGNLYLWLKKNNYPTGFQVLCFNCNCGRSFFGECPHKINNLSNL